MVTLFGFEVEGAWNSKKINEHNIVVQGYHNGLFHKNASLPSWKVETDSSLNTGDTPFLKTTAVEFITRMLASDDVSDSIDELQEEFNCDLKDLVHFNSSCGCHVHFSDTKGDSETFLTYQYLTELRDKVSARIKKELPHIHEEYISQYYRGYAQKTKSEFIDKSERRLEFNFSAMKKGAEWRSFNLKGVKTWEELKRMLMIVTEEIDSMLLRYRGNNKQECVTMSISDDFIADNKVILRLEDD